MTMENSYADGVADGLAKDPPHGISTKPASFNDWPNDIGFEAFQSQTEPIRLNLTGNIPGYAAGVLYRVGPGGHQIATNKNTTYSASHWFDGFSQAHRFVLSPSSDGSHVSESGELGKISFGQKYDPCQSFFKKVMSTFQAATAGKPTSATDANVGVTVTANLPMPGYIANDGDPETTSRNIETLWTKTDTASMQALDPVTLEPQMVTQQAVGHPSLKGPFAAAHARTDPVTGDWFNFNMELGKEATYRVFGVSAKTGDIRILATIKGPGIKPAYIHSFMMTERYVVLCVYAAHLSKGGAAVLWVKNMLEALEFDPKNKNIWFVVDRVGDKGIVGVYESDAFFAFHPVNAWEQPSETEPGKVDIITDVPVYENIDVLKRFYYENLKGTSPTALNYVGEHKDRARASLTRFKLPGIGNSTVLATEKRTKVETVFTVPSHDTTELPTFHPRLATKPNRYTYGVSDEGKSTFIDGLVKFDADTRSAKSWQVHAQSPGEPIFLPDPHGTDEDDGVCLSVVLDGTKGKSYLLVLDAKTFTEVGRAELETAIGFGFHGSHVTY